jgi:hypothetical protein
MHQKPHSAEAEEYLPNLLRKKGKPDTDLAAALHYLKSKVKPVEKDSYGLFETEAKARLAAPLADCAASACGTSSA